eukprot:scaffold363010_cov23-Prasinocladus_malaysianus.AAC.2
MICYLSVYPDIVCMTNLSAAPLFSAIVCTLRAPGRVLTTLNIATAAPRPAFSTRRHSTNLGCRLDA